MLEGAESQRPKVMGLVCVVKGEIIWIDVTVVNGVTEQKRCSGGIEKYRAAKSAASEKMKKYADNARFQRACLLPAALNTFGAISGTFHELVKCLVAMCFPLAARQRIAEEKAQLLECIGVELVKRQ